MLKQRLHIVRNMQNSIKTRTELGLSVAKTTTK